MEGFELSLNESRILTCGYGDQGNWRGVYSVGKGGVMEKLRESVFPYKNKISNCRDKQRRGKLDTLASYSAASTLVGEFSQLTPEFLIVPFDFSAKLLQYLA